MAIQTAKVNEKPEWERQWRNGECGMEMGICGDVSNGDVSNGDGDLWGWGFVCGMSSIR
jgi:hypothetical protein